MQSNLMRALGSSVLELANDAPDYCPSVTFSDGSRLINHPLDEVYIVPPGNTVPEGMLPRAEHQVRAAMLEMIFFTNRLVEFGFLNSLFQKSEYIKVKSIATDKQKFLRSLVNSTPEHKAAIRRIVSAMDAKKQIVLADYCK